MKRPETPSIVNICPQSSPVRFAPLIGLQVSLNDSDETGSLIDEDDESSEDQASRSYSDSNDENF